MNKAIIGKKLGMTQVFTADGAVIPVTVVEAGPCAVVQKKTVERDGYNAVQLMDIADTGNIMPPKTTWFEPKLRSGLVIHKLD